MLVATAESAPFISEEAIRLTGNEMEHPFVHAKNGRGGDCSRTIHELSLDPGWIPTLDEEGRVVSVYHDQFGSVMPEASLSTVELAMKPFGNLYAAKDAYTHLAKQVSEIALSSSGSILLGVGRHPVMRGTPFRWLDSPRYRALVSGLGNFAVHTALEGCSGQVTTDVRSSDEMMLARDVFEHASPFIIGLMANASVYHGSHHPNNKASRQGMWKKLGPDRVEMCTRHAPTLREYMGWFADRKMIFFQDPEQAGKYIVSSEPFWKIVSDYEMEGEQFEELRKTHEGCVWEDARIRAGIAAIEIRPGCTQKVEDGIALSAFVAGLMERLPEASDLLFRESGLTRAQLRNAGHDAVKYGMRTRVGRFGLGRPTLELLNLSKDGLGDRPFGEENLLSPLWERQAKLRSPAVKLGKVFQQRGVRGVIREYGIRP